MPATKPLPLIILGAGGHAQVLIDTLLLRGAVIEGVLDSDVTTHGTAILGVRVLGGEELLNDRATESCRLVNAIGSVRQPCLRQSVSEKFTALGFRFADVIHPSATVSPNASIGEGAQIMAGAVVQAGVHIGAAVIVNTCASVDHDCAIGAHTHIAPGATLSGQVQVGVASHIGTGAVVVQGVCIGAGCVVGAGAVVLNNVPDGATVMGMPAMQKDSDDA